VNKADAIMRDDPSLNHEYLPIAGLPQFTSSAARLILGKDCAALAENRVCSPRCTILPTLGVLCC
jgi:aspartate aminotransferase